MQNIYVTTRILGRYGVLLKRELPSITKYFIDPFSDKTILLRYLRSIRFLKPHQGLIDIPEEHHCPPPNKGSIIVLKVHVDLDESEPIGTMWEILDENHESIKTHYPLRDAP